MYESLQTPCQDASAELDQRWLKSIDTDGESDSDGDDWERVPNNATSSATFKAPLATQGGRQTITKKEVLHLARHTIPSMPPGAEHGELLYMHFCNPAAPTRRLNFTDLCSVFGHLRDRHELDVDSNLCLSEQNVARANLGPSTGGTIQIFIDNAGLARGNVIVSVGSKSKRRIVRKKLLNSAWFSDSQGRTCEE